MLTLCHVTEDDDDEDVFSWKIAIANAASDGSDHFVFSYRVSKFKQNEKRNHNTTDCNIFFLTIKWEITNEILPDFLPSLVRLFLGLRSEFRCEIQIQLRNYKLNSKSISQNDTFKILPKTSLCDMALQEEAWLPPFFCEVFQTNCF